MSAFRVGQKVVCVDDGNKHLGALQYGLMSNLVKGQIYEVTAISTAKDDGCLCLNVAECAPPEPCTSFAAYLFRPLVTRKTDISCFEALLNTKSEKELV